MSARQIALAGATVTILASLAGASPALAASRPSCSAGSTLALGKNARVFVVKRSHTRRVYGCATHTRRVTYLGRVANSNGEGASVDTSLIATSGPRVAYVGQRCNDNGCPDTLFVFDLKARRLLSMAAASPVDLDNRVTEIVLSAKGVVAWISEDLSGDPPMPIARYVSARPLATGPFSLISTGLDIVPGSLALAGSTLYWTQGTARSAPLP